MHPAKQYRELFSDEKPQVAATYQWSLGLDDETGLLSLAKGKDLNLRIWLDVLFIDQLSTNIPMNLAKAQEVYGLSEQHWVFGTKTLLTRGWCLFELCLRASQKKQSLILGSLGNKVTLMTGVDWYFENDVLGCRFMMKITTSLLVWCYSNQKTKKPSKQP